MKFQINLQEIFLGKAEMEAVYTMTEGLAELVPDSAELLGQAWIYIGKRAATSLPSVV